MVLERDIISLLISSICRLIFRLFWSSSAFKVESLAASCSFRKRWRASNSSLICVSVCSAWFWKVTWLKGNHSSTHNSLVPSRWHDVQMVMTVPWHVLPFLRREFSPSCTAAASLSRAAAHSSVPPIKAVTEHQHFSARSVWQVVRLSAQRGAFSWHFLCPGSIPYKCKAVQYQVGTNLWERMWYPDYSKIDWAHPTQIARKWQPVDSIYINRWERGSRMNVASQKPCGSRVSVLSGHQWRQQTKNINLLLEC